MRAGSRRHGKRAGRRPGARVQQVQPRHGSAADRGRGAANLRFVSAKQGREKVERHDMAFLLFSAGLLTTASPCGAVALTQAALAELHVSA